VNNTIDNQATCKFCGKNFIKKNRNHKFCSRDCSYCWHRGDGTKWEGLNYNERSALINAHAWDLELAKTKQGKRKPHTKLKDNKDPSHESVRDRKRRIQSEFSQSRTNEKPGFIYLIKCEVGLYKIGRTKDIVSRIKMLEREIPIKMELIHNFHSNNYILAEKIMHQRYSEFRVRYEWFNLNDSHVAEIMAIKDGDFLDSRI